jgi:hypothetical protein
MKYSIIKCINTNYSIHGEYPTINAAKIAFHQFCAALWNDPSTQTAMVKIMDENLNCAEGYMEFIHHEQEQTNEPE